MAHVHYSDSHPPNTHHHLNEVISRLRNLNYHLIAVDRLDLADILTCVFWSTQPSPLIHPAKPLPADNRPMGALPDGNQQNAAVVAGDVATDRQAREFQL